MKKILYTTIFVCVTCILFAQVPGSWNAHFSYRSVVQVEFVDDNIFALAENGLFIYNESSKEIQTLSKVNGLSSVGLNCMAYCEATASFIIGYADGMLDIVSYPSLQVKPVPTIMQKNIYGSKAINRIVIAGDTAIIATDFGLLTYSMSDKHFITTTVLSLDGSYLPVRSVAVDETTIYVATNAGLYSVERLENLSDFSLWKQRTGIPHANDTIGQVAVCAGNLYYANHSEVASGQYDSVYVITDTVASPFKFQPGYVTNIVSRGNTCSIVGRYSARMYDETGKLLQLFDSLDTNNDYRDFVKSQAGDYYVPDAYFGLRHIGYTGVILPNGPNSNAVNEIYYRDNQLHMVSGSVSLWTMFHYSVLTEGGGWYGHTNWKLANSICVYPMPQESVYYVGTYGYGFAENTVAWQTDTVYALDNSEMHNYYLSDKNCAVYDITSDASGMLWIVNPGNEYPLIAWDRKKTWYPFYFAKSSGSLYNQQNLYNHVLVDSRNTKWLTGTGKLVAFTENGTFDDDTDDITVTIPLTDGEGTIASRTTCVAEDIDGTIWVGTNQGIAIHSSPSRVFKDRQTISRIKIEIDGEVGYLLSAESITCIAVDAANRKWIGTENSGVFLISENGTEQLLNFTKTNSPLPSNYITSIAIDQSKGEVYIATENGLVSYISDATMGDASMESIKIYPNPVRGSYEGNVYIEGLVYEATVKITDISGNLVQTLTSNGGTAVWDGKNTSGSYVRTGVYLVYVSDETGTYTKVTKLAVVR